MLSGVGKLLEEWRGISCSSSSGLKDGCSSPPSSDPSPSQPPDLSPYMTGITVVPSIECQLQISEFQLNREMKLTDFAIFIPLFRLSNFEDLLQKWPLLSIFRMILVIEP